MLAQKLRTVKRPAAVDATLPPPFSAGSVNAAGFAPTPAPLLERSTALDPPTVRCCARGSRSTASCAIVCANGAVLAESVPNCPSARSVPDGSMKKISVPCTTDRWAASSWMGTPYAEATAASVAGSPVPKYQLAA